MGLLIHQNVESTFLSVMAIDKQKFYFITYFILKIQALNKL